MKKRLLSWLLVLCMAVTLLPVEISAAEDMACTCGAVPGEDGQTVHLPECPQYAETEIPAPAEDPACTCGTGSGEDGQTVHLPECPQYAEPEIPAPAEDPACTCGAVPGEDGQTIHLPECPLYAEPEPLPLTAPSIAAAAYDEEVGSMVLTVAGEWDTYAWEACAYGSWSPWEGNGPTVLLEKGDFVSHGFRCTVTKGEQSITSEVYAYDEMVLEPPAMSLMAAGDSLSEEGDYMRYAPASRYNRRFDIFGQDDGDIRTTYDGSGYRTVIQVEGSTAKTEIRYREGATSAENSLTAETFLEIDSSGRYVKVTYCVTNKGSTSQTFQIGTEADVMIGANDRARVSRTSNGLKMEGSWLGFDLLNAYNFYLVAPTCDTLWYGYYADSYQNIFEDRNDGETYGKDSGMAWSWTGTVAPGETWERYVLIGAGKIPEGPDAPILAETLPNLIPGQDTAITGTAEAGSTVHVYVDGEEYTTTADENGNFSVGVTLPADFEQEQTTLQVWTVGTDGGVSDVTERTVGGTPLPKMVLTTHAVSIMADAAISDSWYNTYINQTESRGTVTHSGTVTTAEPGTYNVTYTATVAELPEEFRTDTASLAVTVLPQPAALGQTSFEEQGETYTLTARMTYTGGKTWTETGFVYGVIQNPTLALCDGSVTTDGAVSEKNGTLTASVLADDLTYGITYYARSYARATDGTVIYGPQSGPFGPGTPQYGTFSVTNNGDNTFTITRTGGSAGEQTVYYRTVNGSAIGGTHFTHQADKLTFREGEKEKEVTISEESAAAPYKNDTATYTATAYSNADRVYFLEIYQVTGGATIDTARDQAMRTMAVDDAHRIDQSDYNTLKIDADVNSGSQKHILDRTKDQGAGNNTVNFTEENRNGVLNWSRQTGVEELYDAKTATYLAATDGYWLYRFAMTAQGTEANEGRQDMWFGYQSPQNGDLQLSGATTAKDFAGQIWYGIYTFTETSPAGGGKRPTILGNTGLISPTGDGQDSYATVAPDGTAQTNDRILPYGGNYYGKLSAEEDAHIHFSAHGEDTDDWYILRYQEATILRDDNEPDLIGIAPMAGGVYQPGDEITIALIFDEIVDETNSQAAGLNDTAVVHTNWGTFQYEGGLGTNALYCTGIVPEGASGTITINSADGDILTKVRDMSSGNTDDTVTVPDNIQTTIEVSNAANSPTAVAGAINNANGTLTATVSGINAAKLEYAWSDQTDPEKVSGWKIVQSGTTVTTARTEGTWHLHVRATGSNGLEDYDMKSITLAAGAVTVPTITASVENTGWAKEREITIERTPADAAVSVSGPAGDTELNTETTYTATAEGLYTFTMTVDGETYSASVTVANLDREAPTVEISGPAETTHIEPVTLTLQVSDNQSGVDTVTGIWSNGESVDASLTQNADGTWTTVSPNRGGTWILTITATDHAGNTITKKSSSYTVILTAPTVEISGPTKTGSGYEYTYTVNENGAAITSIELPGGTILESGDEGFALTGTFTLTEPGTYTVSVTDSAGHVVISNPITIVEEAAEDFTPPEVRLSLETDEDDGTVTAILVSVYEKGGLNEPSTFTWKRTEETEEQNGVLTADSEAQGAYEGSITPVRNGTYSVTVTDAAGHVTTTEITIAGNDETPPEYHGSSAEASTWYCDELDVELRFLDEGAGLAPLPEVQYALLPKGEEPAQTDWRTPSGSWTSLTETGDFPAGTKGFKISIMDTGRWTIWYRVPDVMGNTLQGSFGPVWVDTTQPVITVTPQTGEAGELTARIVTNSAISGVTVTVSEQGQSGSTDITNGTYTFTAPGSYTFTAATGAGKRNSETITVYKVTVNDGTGSIKTQLVQEGARIPAPAQPVRDGYTFMGWQDGTGQHVTFPVTVTEDTNTNFTAVWILNAPTVTITGNFTGTYNGGQPAVTLTADVKHDAAGLECTYQWYKAGESDTLLDGETKKTLTLKDVADSGRYYVEVGVTDGAQTSGESLTSEPVSVEIIPKSIAVGWSGRTQVYDGTAKAIIAKAAGLMGEDTCAVTLTYADEAGNPVAAPTAAGTYTATARAGNLNYTIFNDTEILTIEPAPVTFAVTENVKVYQEGAGPFAAKVIPTPADLTDSDYTITYRNSQGQVTQPEAAGTYTIWAEITDPNYRHAGAADGECRQIGVLTVAQAEPVKYTIAFDGGEATGQGPADLENVLAGTVLLLPDAGTLMKPGFIFAGWLWNDAVYQSGDPFTMPAGDVNFTARWEAVHTISGTVQNADKDPLEEVTVALMLGAEVIDTDTTKNGGAFSFSNVPSGLYNLVAQYEGITVTTKVELANADSTGNTITMPEGMTNSIVTVVGDTPVAVVGNLDSVFAKALEEPDAAYTTQDAETVKNGGIVEVDLTASTPDAKTQEAVKETLQNSPAVNQNATLGLFLDLTVEKTVIPADDETPAAPREIHDTGVLLDTHILLPHALQGKDYYEVYRIHTTGEGGEKKTEVQVLTVGEAADGERIELNADKTVLTIYARYYSDYVLSWWDTPTSPSRPSGSSGSSSSGSAAYPPTVADTDHGTVTVSPTRPGRGQTVTITATPDQGYEVDKVTVTGQNGSAVEVTENEDGTYHFVQPSGRVTVTVTFRRIGSVSDCHRDEMCPMYGFSDLDLGAWYHDGIHYCLENGLMVGTSETAFSPEGTTTRGQIVTILWRLTGSPVVNYLMDFSDVDPAAYYSEAIRWAASEGVVGGYGGGLFGPNDPITREQLAAILWRYAQSQGYDVSVGEETNILSYTDTADLGDYAIPAMQWAVGAGIINGTGDGSTLTPQGKATRAQAAVMLHRFCELAR